MHKRRALLGLIATGGLLSGCGFRLRGSDRAASFPFQRIYVNQPPNTQLGADLRRQLAPYDGLTIVETLQEAQVALHIQSESRDNVILTRNSQGRVREYDLRYAMNYRVTDGSGKELLPASQVAISRMLSYNENAALGKEAEENMLYRDMQLDAIQQIIRRLSLLPIATQG